MVFTAVMEIRKSLEANFLTCKHCHQPYRKPKVLVCLHTFCQSCLEEIWAKKEAEQEAKEIEDAKRYYATSNLVSDYRSGGYRKKWSSRFRYGGGYDSSNYGLTRYNFTTTKEKRITCPVCEKETVLPSGGILDLPTDQLADKLASMVDRMPTFPVCDVCTKQLLLTEPSLMKHTDTDSKSNGQTAFSSSERYGSNADSSSDDSDSDEKEDDSASSMRCFKQNGSLSSDSGVKSGQNSRSTIGRRSAHSSRQRFQIPKQTGKQRRRRKLVSASVKPASSVGPQPASAACLECAKRLCTSCRETHSKMSVTSNHVLIRVEQMDDLQCSRHPRELRRFFCLTCRTYICIVCTFEATVDTSGMDSAKHSGHADHDILSIRQAVTAYQDQLSRESAAVQAQVNQIEALLSSLQVCENEMQRLYAAIDSGAKAYIEQIHRQQVLLRDKVNKVVGVPLDVLTSECNRLTRAANGWYEFLNDEHITSRLDLMDPLEALTEGGPMLDRVGQCLQAASEPLSRELAKQQFLFHLEAAEEITQNGDSGLVSSQSMSPPSNANSIEASEPDDSRTMYWRSRLGQFQPGKLDFGRIVTDKELAAEAIAEAARRVSTHAQTGPELIKALPPPKGAQRHRAVQINLLGANLEDRATQTDPVQIGATKAAKSDVGTQYQSSDINPPISMYRSMKQILVQK